MDIEVVKCQHMNMPTNMNTRWTLSVVLVTMMFTVLSALFTPPNAMGMDAGTASTEATLPAGASGAAELCVLLFESGRNPLVKHVESLFKSIPNSVVVVGARPLDFLDCIKKRYREIIFIAHGVLREDIKSPKPVYQLGYMVDMEINGELHSVPRVFFNEIFNQVYAELKRQQSEPNGVGLQRFRFAACAIEQVMLSHPALYQLIQEFPREYDVAPEAPWPFQSSWSGAEADIVKRSLTYEWLSRSARCESATTWFTERNRFCQKDYWPGCNRRTARFCFGKEYK